MKSQVRIIGGRWRGRKIPVLGSEGLRPTPDRIRETLFNWLAADCRDAAVLDCFAGSGALGFEAASRGAARVVLIERQLAAARHLQQQCERLDTDAIEIIADDALHAIGRLRQRFKLVFIDPPYALPALRGEVFRQLERHDCLEPGAIIYFEWPLQETFNLPADSLHWLKRKSAGRVNYAIAEWRVTG